MKTIFASTLIQDINKSSDRIDATDSISQLVRNRTDDKGRIEPDELRRDLEAAIKAAKVALKEIQGLG